jgi:hypothetical protein
MFAVTRCPLSHKLERCWLIEARNEWRRRTSEGSSLYRDKWERDDYRQRTFRMALETAAKIKEKGPQITFEQTTPSATAEDAKAADPSKDVKGTFPYGDNEIPAFDDTVITGIFREIVDFVTAGTTIPRQFPFLAAKVYVGARMAAGGMTFEGVQDDPTMYGTPIGESGTSKGLSWERTIFQTLLLTELGKRPVKVIYSFDSGAGLRDAFFDPPKELPARKPLFYAGFCWRRGWESNPRIKVLQTSPLPLGYRASAFLV